MIHRRSTKRIIYLITSLFILLAASCGTDATPTPSPEATEQILFTPTATQAVSIPTASPTPQSMSAPVILGPDQNSFPEGYNPLSGQLVEDPNSLTTPALLISISHFPATARPQAGLSFAPWVFEFYITEGATRFLSVFYGDYPKPEIPVIGNCEVRKNIFVQISNILGNRVWLDKNKNGRQESYEPGVGGVCVNIYDGAGQLVDSTTTDTNGYYGFNVSGAEYTVEFLLPEGLAFTTQNVGDENADSDADQLSGKADANAGVNSTLLYLDAGLILSEESVSAQSESTELPKAEVGPIRSGRLLYADIGAFFQNSCLIYAFASEEVLELIPKCSFVAHTFTDGGSMMPLERMNAIAEDNKKHTPKEFNYASNLFKEEAPEGGVPASQLDVYVALLNQSGWMYDPAVGAWQRFVDDAKKDTVGQLHAEIDRLTGRQLKFENIIIVYADHDVFTPTNLDIHLELGGGGFAALFRDGRKYDIRWSLKTGEYEKTTGRRTPIHFVNTDGSPAALKPGHTWIFIATPYSILSDDGNGVWNLRYYAPEGAK